MGCAFIRKLLVMRKKLRSNSKYLKNGLYVLHSTQRTYIRLFDQDNDIFPQGQVAGKARMRLLVGRVLPVMIMSSQKQFDGTSAYFSNMPDIGQADIKIFSTSKKEVLTVCPSSQRFEDVISRKREVLDAFPCAQLIKVEPQSLMYIEQLVIKGKSPTYMNQLFERLVAYYMIYYQQQRAKGEYQESKEGLKLFMHHGDLSADNVILDGDGRLVFIDFDHCGWYPACYDLLYFGVNVFISKGNSSFINRMLDGDVKQLIEEGMVCEGITMVQCVDAFIVYFAEEWVSPLGGSIRERYLSLFAQMKNGKVSQGV